MKIRRKPFLLSVLLILTALPLFTDTLYKAHEGVLDLREYSPDSGSPVALDGEWEYYPQKLSDPAVIDNTPSSDFLSLPGELHGYNGTATFRLKILLPVLKDPAHADYGIKISYFGAAMKVWIDGRPVAETGSFSPFVPRYLPREVFFTPGAEETEIIIQTANFHHRRLRLSRIFFGSSELIQKITQRAIIKNAILTGSLLLLSFFHFLLYLSYHRDKAFLYFSIIALITALREGIVNERILVRLWPSMPGELMMKIGYAPVFLLLPLILHYVWATARQSAPKPSLLAAKLLMAASLILLIFFPLKVYDWFFQYALIPIAVYALYSLRLIFSSRMFESPFGAHLLVLGGLVVLFAATNDYLREISILHTPALLSTAILFFLLLQAFFLSWRLERSQTETMQLALEVKNLNATLETSIMERTRELEQVNRRLEKLSRIDPLTEIPNRRYFDEVFLGEWRRSEREDRPLSVIMIDVDFFKPYNDNYGHPAGDDCLKTLADAIQVNLKRGEDFVARYGGEEFIVLLPGHPLESAEKVAEKIRTQVEGLGIIHDYSEAGEVVTISLGVAEKPLDRPLERKELIKWADQALYDSKRLGRNRTSVALEPAT
jgi:diguanylate cyclase (GGDEF)-like protein